MKVFIVEGGWDYEGFQIWGVYHTQEGADSGVIQAKAMNRYDWVRINEYEVW
jgi:hypothetical protein